MAKRKLDSNDCGGTGIEVRFYPNWFEHAPRCAHGPMLLFERYKSGKQSPLSYYACSANRDRKQCPNFVLKEDHLTSKSKFEDEPRGNTESFHCVVSCKEVQRTSPENRSYCFQCQQFILDNSDLKSHKKHKILNKISDVALREPTKNFISPKQNDKVHAQYFLSERSTTFLLSCMKMIGSTHVLCIGMPRLHERIQLSPDKAVKSLLLDIDHRYKSFWTDDKFLRFNMFNHYFFKDTSQKIFDEFLKDASDAGNDLAVVLDPPFGGLVDCIAECLNWLKQQVVNHTANQKPKIFWLFPYFMEGRILTSLPDMAMLDYCVDYDNHRKFKNAASGRKVSPVRIFTNVKNSSIKLPLDEGYRLCERCIRYVSQQNKHCSKCDTCPSKDGRQYVHCDECKKCVKPGRQHCSVCKRCELPGHVCDPNFRQLGCHVCGQVTHKRRDCPLRGAPVAPPAPMKNTLPIVEDGLQAENPVDVCCTVRKSRHKSIGRHNPSHHRKFANKVNLRPRNLSKVFWRDVAEGSANLF